MPIFDISDEVVEGLGTTYSSPASSTGTVTDSIRWDCAVGGLPFLFAYSREFPHRRETAPFRKDRVDTEREPGEQSLDSGYWLRSQASWHYGSGLSSAEPIEVSSEEARFRYKRGGGVNPWTPGQVTLLNDTSLSLSSAGSTQHLIGVDTGYLHADGTVVKYVTTGGSATAVTWGGGSAVTSLTSDGASYYAANATGIYKGTLPSSAGSLLWNTGSSTLVRWVKSRLFAAVGLSLYELVGGTPPTLPTALYTHPTTGWTWTDVSEGPSAIYAAGYAGDQSIIYRITIGTTTTTVTLDQPTVVAEMPRGELVKSLYSYVGTYMIVGTSKGVRIAVINTDGSLSIGPLVVESADGCSDAVAVGSFVYVTMGAYGEGGDRSNRAGLWRIDLGSSLVSNPLKFAAAADLTVPAGIGGSCSQVTSAGGLLFFTSSGVGVYKQNTTYVSEGWMETGRIRLGTVESKAWRTLRIQSDKSKVGTVTAYASVSENSTPSTWSAAVSASNVTGDETGSLNAAAGGPVSALYLAFKLTQGSSADTPAFVGYQLKAVPAPDRAELVSVPLLNFDRECDSRGVWSGDDGRAWTRFQQLKVLEESSSTIQWRDYTTGETAEAFIEQVSFHRTTPPTRNQSGAGGILTVLLRLV